jgi:SAM-dependent methyltransferase
MRECGVPDKRVYFDERIAPLYDTTAAHMYAPEVLDPAVDFLADAARGGAALEFAIGTGRVAIPLAQRGLRVSGIELSPAMVEQLRAKRESHGIDVTIGDMVTTRIAGEFALVYIVFNSMTNLTTQADQADCFRNAAAHLAPGGRLVVECVVPDLRRLAPGENMRVFASSPGYIGFDEYTDFEAQILYSHHWWVTNGATEVFSAPYRYVWPSEFDLMASMAGLTFRERWSTWTKEPFTGESESAVSVWEKVSR